MVARSATIVALRATMIVTLRVTMIVTDAPANYKTSPSYIAYITEGYVKKAILLCQAKGDHGCAYPLKKIRATIVARIFFKG